MAWNWHFWSFWARPCQLIWCPVGGLVGGFGAQAVSRKSFIYFIVEMKIVEITTNRQRQNEMVPPCGEKPRRAKGKSNARIKRLRHTLERQQFVSNLFWLLGRPPRIKHSVFWALQMGGRGGSDFDTFFCGRSFLRKGFFNHQFLLCIIVCHGFELLFSRLG